MLFNWIQRIRHSKGFGIHSPFAFNFITNVIYSKHWYYAFADIEYILMKSKIGINSYKLNHISYRLIQYFKPTNVLQIGIDDGVNATYTNYSNIVTSFDCVESDYESISSAEKLQHEIGKSIYFLDNIHLVNTYDSIFVNIERDIVDINTLIEISNANAFWVVYRINSKKGKQYWRSIVKDERVSVTFDMRDIGIVLLNKKYKKQNYLV